MPGKPAIKIATAADRLTLTLAAPDGRTLGLRTFPAGGAARCGDYVVAAAWAPGAPATLYVFAAEGADALRPLGTREIEFHRPPAVAAAPGGRAFVVAGDRYSLGFAFGPGPRVHGPVVLPAGRPHYAPDGTLFLVARRRRDFLVSACPPGSWAVAGPHPYPAPARCELAATFVGSGAPALYALLALAPEGGAPGYALVRFGPSAAAEQAFELANFDPEAGDICWAGPGGAVFAGTSVVELH